MLIEATPILGREPVVVRGTILEKFSPRGWKRSRQQRVPSPLPWADQPTEAEGQRLCELAQTSLQEETLFAHGRLLLFLDALECHFNGKSMRTILTLAVRHDHLPDYLNLPSHRERLFSSVRVRARDRVPAKRSTLVEWREGGSATFGTSGRGMSARRSFGQIITTPVNARTSSGGSRFLHIAIGDADSLEGA